MATSKYAYTNSGQVTQTIGNIINSKHFSYVKVYLGSGNSSIKGCTDTGVDAFTTTAYDLPVGYNSFKYDLNNNLPNGSGSVKTYITYVQPVWYGASKSYTVGNAVTTTLYAYQNNNITSAEVGHAVLWSTFTNSGSAGEAGATTGTGGTTTFSYKTNLATGATAYDPTTAYTSSSAEIASVSSNGTVTAGATAGTASLTATSKDPVGKSASASISVVSPEFTYGSKFLSATGSTTYALSNVSTHSSDIVWTVTSPATIVNGTLNANSTTASSITITATHGTNGVYGTRTFTFGIISIPPITLTNKGNQGDTVEFSFSGSDINFGTSTSSVVSRQSSDHTMTTAEISTVFTVTNITVLSCIYTKSTNTWSGVVSLNSTGTGTLTVKYVDGQTESATTSIENITISIE